MMLTDEECIEDQITEITMTDSYLSQEHSFINFKQNDSKLKYARQKIVNCRFSSKIFSLHDDCTIVGFTLNKSKTKVIRLFYNKHNKPEGDLVCESVHYPVKVGIFNPRWRATC